MEEVHQWYYHNSSYCNSMHQPLRAALRTATWLPAARLSTRATGDGGAVRTISSGYHYHYQWYYHYYHSSSPGGGQPPLVYQPGSNHEPGCSTSHPRRTAPQPTTSIWSTTRQEHTTAERTAVRYTDSSSFNKHSLLFSYLLLAAPASCRYP